MDGIMIYSKISPDHEFSKHLRDPFYEKKNQQNATATVEDSPLKSLCKMG
jgi:hypothetical protein